jgi:ankyrin repeat protein
MIFARFSLVALFVAAVSAQTDTSRDALFLALQRGASGEVGRLLASGVSPNLVDADGTTALMAGTLFADADTVELLLKRGADPNKADASGSTALMWAVSDEEKVRLLVAHGANVNAKSTTERTPLLVAAALPRTTGVLRILLDRGADLRAQDRAGATALALAVRSADVDVVRFLVERGLDPNALSVLARRPGFVRDDRPTFDYLMSKGLTPPPDLLVTAVTWQPAAAIGRWIDLGANVNAGNTAQYNRTPLLTAVTSETEGTETLKLLLDHGADANVRTTEGESPLDWAIYKGDRAKIEVLEKHGATRGNGPRREEIPPPAKGGIADPRISLNRSVARLLDVAPRFREQATCISCHHNAMPAIAAAAARRKGIEIDEVRARKNLDDMLTFFKNGASRMMLGDPAVGGGDLTAGYVQLGFAAEGHPFDKVTATTTHWLIARQMPDGRWVGNGVNRPPIEYSTISHTAIAAGGLISYPIPGRRNEMKESLRRARQWLLAAQPKSTTATWSSPPSSRQRKLPGWGSAWRRPSSKREWWCRAKRSGLKRPRRAGCVRRKRSAGSPGTNEVTSAVRSERSRSSAGTERKRASGKVARPRKAANSSSAFPSASRSHSRRISVSSTSR